MAVSSYVVGVTEPPLLDLTIGQALDRAVSQWPHSEALVCAHQGIRLTWSQLLYRTDEFAAGLLALGVEIGDRIGIWAPNCAEWTIAQFAAARAGLILVNINPAYRISELEYTLNAVQIRVLICAVRFKKSDYIAMVEDLTPEASKGYCGEPADCQNTEPASARFYRRTGTIGMVSFR